MACLDRGGVGGRMCLCRELSPPRSVPPVCPCAQAAWSAATPGAVPVQTWSSAANFRNDLSTQLLLTLVQGRVRGRSGQGEGM